VKSLSHLSTTELIVLFNFDLSFFKTDTAITFLEVPHCLPKAFLDGTNTYGIFFSSARTGRWRTISNGLASAAIITRLVIVLLSVLVTSLAPFLICLLATHSATKS
jgi:hypothetical protein